MVQLGPHRLFISFPSPHLAEAKLLGNMLRKFSPFVHSADTALGHRWNDSIEVLIQQVACVVCLVTVESRSASYHLDEVVHTLATYDDAETNSQPLVVPLIVGNARPQLGLGVFAAIHIDDLSPGALREAAEAIHDRLTVHEARWPEPVSNPDPALERTGRLMLSGRFTDALELVPSLLCHRPVASPPYVREVVTIWARCLLYLEESPESLQDFLLSVGRSECSGTEFCWWQTVVQALTTLGVTNSESQLLEVRSSLVEAYGPTQELNLLQGILGKLDERLAALGVSTLEAQREEYLSRLAVAQSAGASMNLVNALLSGSLTEYRAERYRESAELAVQGAAMAPTRERRAVCHLRAAVAYLELGDYDNTEKHNCAAITAALGLNKPLLQCNIASKVRRLALMRGLIQGPDIDYFNNVVALADRIPPGTRSQAASFAFVEVMVAFRERTPVEQLTDMTQRCLHLGPSVAVKLLCRAILLHSAGSAPREKCEELVHDAVRYNYPGVTLQVLALVFPASDTPMAHWVTLAKTIAPRARAHLELMSREQALCQVNQFVRANPNRTGEQ